MTVNVYSPKGTLIKEPAAFTVRIDPDSPIARLKAAEKGGDPLRPILFPTVKDTDTSRVRPIRAMDPAAFEKLRRESSPLTDQLDNLIIHLDGRNDYPGLDYLAFYENRAIAATLDSIGVCPVNQSIGAMTEFLKLCRERGIQGGHTLVNSILAYKGKYKRPVTWITEYADWFAQPFVQKEVQAIEQSVRRGEQVILVSKYPTTKWAIVNQIRERLGDVLPQPIKSGKRLLLPGEKVTRAQWGDTMVTVHQMPLVDDGKRLVVPGKTVPGKVERGKKLTQEFPGMEHDGRPLMTTTQSEISSDARSKRSQADRLRDECTLDMLEMVYIRDEDSGFASLRNPQFDSVAGELV